MKMNTTLMVVAAFLMSSAAMAQSESAKCEKAVQRVRNANCYLSGNDAQRIAQGAAKCRQLQAKGNTLEVFLLDKSNEGSGKVVTVETNGTRYSTQACPSTKYTIDYDGIDDFKILAQRAVMLSKPDYAGKRQVYFMTAGEAVYELLTADRNHYASVVDIKGVQADPKVAVLVFRSGYEEKIDEGDFTDYYRRRPLRFVRSDTNRSLFRDE
jgi:hypothetical protein